MEGMAHEQQEQRVQRKRLVSRERT